MLLVLLSEIVVNGFLSFDKTVQDAAGHRATPNRLARFETVEAIGVGY
jgi:hypothetical protein